MIWCHKFNTQNQMIKLPADVAGSSYSLGAESLLWLRDGFECFDSRCSLDEPFVDEEFPLLVDLLLLLLLELSFVLLLLLLLPPSPADTFRMSVLKLLDELLVFVWLVFGFTDCDWELADFEVNGGGCWIDDDDIDELPTPLFTLDFLCADLWEPFCDDDDCFWSAFDGAVPAGG